MPELIPKFAPSIFRNEGPGSFTPPSASRYCASMVLDLIMQSNRFSNEVLKWAKYIAEFDDPPTDYAPLVEAE